MNLGIDLGTSNSVVAGFKDGKVQIFRPDDGGQTLPSVIWVDKRGHRLYGRRAYDKSLISPENAVSGFNTREIDGCIRLEGISISQINNDILIEGYPTKKRQ